MAQQRVTSYFTARKRGADLQPSKRLKVEAVDILTTEPYLAPRKGRTAKQEEAISQEIKLSRQISEGQAKSEVKVAEPSVKATTKTKQKAGTQGKTGRTTSRNRIKTTRGKQKEESKTQPRVSAFFSPEQDPITSTVPVSVTGKRTESNSCGSEAAPNTSIGNQAEKAVSVTSVPSAAHDDHCVSPQSSPSKRSSSDGTTATVRKRGRKVKTTSNQDSNSCQTPEKGYDFTVAQQRNSSAKKRLFVRAAEEASQDVLLVCNKPAVKEEASFTDERKEVETNKSGFEKLLEIKSEPQGGSVSPDPDIRTVYKDKIVSTSGDSKGMCGEKEAHATPAEMKAKLARCGKLSELKEKLASFSQKKSAYRQGAENCPVKVEVKPVVKSEEKPKKAPAYQRFHALASPVPPSLTLPFKYRVLADLFQGADTVVSMLHNRYEVCTFSKLKAAVQQMVRKNFETKTLGQIKTVMPNAYVLRQEKGLPMAGKKSSGYQLTVEACLDTGSQDTPVNPATGRPEFPAAKLLERKSIFHRNLVNIVKQHHKEFLSSLARPLSIPDEKITRWHPKFPLDEVPDVETSPLPQSPDVKKLTSARDVLEQAQSRLPSKVQKALETVARATDKKNNQEKPNKIVTPHKTSPSSTPKETNSALKGVPQSLLERIRAKEAQRLEATMMRSKEDDDRLKMLERLPDLVRIMRSFFVTQKKPALPKQEAIDKVRDSYRSSIGAVEMESHLKLMLELLPEWITLVTVRQGQFLKIDKNKDIGPLVDKLRKLQNQC